MKTITFACMLAIMAASQAKADDVDQTDKILQYNCNDRIVVGRVQSAGYDPIPDEDDSIGHGVIAATITILKMVKGQPLPEVLPASYVAHSAMRADQDFMLVLDRESDGSFWITSEQLMSDGPKLAAECTS